MKKVITLAVIALTILSASAQFGQSILNLRMSDNAPFKIFIDGQQTGGIGSVAKFSNLQGGKHFLQVYRVDNSWGYENLGNTYRGFIVLTYNAESWVTVYADLQKIKFDDIRAFNNPSPVDPNIIDCHYPQLPVGEKCHTNFENNFPPAPVGPIAMCPSDFNQLKQTMNNASFESTRMLIFKQVLSYSYFTTSQVRELMSMFWFEDTKLDVAKLAFPKTIDQNNYYLVYNEFSFSSSVDDLGNYIAMR